MMVARGDEPRLPRLFAADWDGPASGSIAWARMVALAMIRARRPGLAPR